MSIQLEKAKSLDLPKLKAHHFPEGKMTIAVECKEDGGSFTLYPKEILPFYNWLKPIAKNLQSQEEEVE